MVLTQTLQTRSVVFDDSLCAIAHLWTKVHCMWKNFRDTGKDKGFIYPERKGYFHYLNHSDPPLVYVLTVSVSNLGSESKL